MSGNRIWRAAAAYLLLASASPRATQAQTDVPSVQWGATARRDSTDPTGRRATLDLFAVVPEGWHVYALNQAPGGPTPLHVALEEGAAARVTGPVSGSAPEKRHDPSFDLDTEFYTHSVALHLPLESQRPLIDSSTLPVRVRFQLCSERECQPPKTVHLLASIMAAAK
jgi:hypothetical protein